MLGEIIRCVNDKNTPLAHCRGRHLANIHSLTIKVPHLYSCLSDLGGLNIESQVAVVTS